jgi:hypothetical protein
MAQLTKITMNLTDRDVKNAEKLSEKLKTRTKADAVSAAISIATFLIDILQDDKELIIRDEKNNMRRIIIPRLSENGLN